MFASCNKKNGDDGGKPVDDILYPYTEYEFLHLGNKSGLTSSSSEQAFSNGLNEVLETWAANNPSTGEVVFDGVTYEFTNWQEATGAVPNRIWDVFWEKLDEYSYSIGSCWAFSEVIILSKGGTGTVYVLYTIVTHLEGEVRYIALKCNMSPKTSTNTRSAEIYNLDYAEKFNELLKSAKIKRKCK